MDRGRGLERLNSIYDSTQPQPYVMDVGVKRKEILAILTEKMQFIRISAATQPLYHSMHGCSQ